MLWGDVNITQTFHLVSNTPQGWVQAHVCPCTDVQRNCTASVLGWPCSTSCCHDLHLTHEWQQCSAAISLPQNQMPAHSKPSIYACCCLSTQSSLDSWVSLFFLKYLLLFDVQSFIYCNNEESSVWGRKAQFKILLRKSWMPTAFTVEDDRRSITIFLLIFSLEVVKGKMNEWFPCSSNICKSCVNEDIFDKILVSLKLK